MYVNLTDFRGQLFVATVPDEIPATASSLATKRTPEKALRDLRRKIVDGEPIECEIAHNNNRGQTLTIFHGPVTLSYHYSKETT